jgi:hypothetical protein
VNRLVLAAGVTLAILVSACKKPIEFFPLPQFAQEGGCTDPRRPAVRGFRREPIVVANPPSARDEIRRVLEAYNRRTLTDAQLEPKCWYTREFYRETGYTTRDYQERNVDFDQHDRFEDHYKDMFVTVEWRGGHSTAKYVFFEEGEPVK